MDQRHLPPAQPSIGLIIADFSPNAPCLTRAGRERRTRSRAPVALCVRLLSGSSGQLRRAAVAGGVEVGVHAEAMSAMAFVGLPAGRSRTVTPRAATHTPQPVLP